MIFRGLLCASVLVAMPASGLAPPDTGSLLRGRNSAEVQDGSNLAGNDVRPVLENYASCLVKERYLRVKKVLDLPVGTEQQHAALTSLSTEQCLVNGSLRFSDAPLRWSLYKALVQRDAGKVQEVVFPTNVAFGDGQGNAVQKFTVCVAGRQPAATRDLLLARAGSAEEKAAMKLIRPEFVSCADPSQGIAVDKMEFIGVLAEVFYRGVIAPQAKSAS